MTQLVAKNIRTNSERRTAFRTALLEPGLIVAPGVYDGISALIAAEAGFPALYLSGGAVARSAGLPDLGILSSAEMRERIREVIRATDLPVIADADTGYGGIFNVMRTVRELEEIGVVALHLEDQVEPKKCGHYEKKELIAPVEMSAKIVAAVEARSADGLLIIARTDAIAVEGFEAALERAQQYRDAGADIIFIEAFQSREQMEIAIQRIGAPMLINMFHGGKTPLLPSQTVEEIGFKLMIVPSDLQRAALFAMREAARILKNEGSTASLQKNMLTFAERDELVKLAEYSTMEAEFLTRVIDRKGI